MATVKKAVGTEAVLLTEKPPVEERLVSLDALRGVDMFWIIGGDAIFRSLNKISSEGWVGALADQFEHVSWEGFRFYDLIFPLFIFIIGVSLVYSLDKIVAKEGLKKAHIRVLKRGALMFLLGVLYDEGLANIYEENVLCGVLQRLALCYTITALLYLNLSRKALFATFVVILVAYWALLSFVPVPGVGHPSFEKRENWTHYIDRQLPPYHDTDPEGGLSTLPAVASCLLGVYAAFQLRDTKRTQTQRVQLFIGLGIVMVVLGYLWGLQFPIIKRLWTSSYVILAGGYSFILLGIFYQVVDVWKYRKWATPFLWIGMNPLTIYLATTVVDFDKIARYFVGGPIAASIEPFGELLVTAVSLGLAILLVRFLYKKQIFLRV